MASGIITLTAYGKLPSYLNGRIVWESVSNGTAANTSTVTAQIQISRNSSVATTGTWYGSLNVNGTTKQISYYASVGSSWVTIDTMTATVTHNADGSGNCYIYGVLNGPTGTALDGTYVNGSATVTLDKIARYASIISATNFTDEGNPTITYSNPAGTAVTSLKACISLDGTTANIPYKDIPMTETSYTFSLTESERNTLRAAAPNSNAITVVFFVWTVIGDGYDYSTTTAQMSIVNANPTLSPTVVDTNDATTKVTGDSSILVAGHSTARVTINATAKKYATIASRKVEHGTQILTGDGTLSVTNNPIKITVTDSRGNQAQHTATNYIVPYINPTCSISNNMPATDGTFNLVVSGLFFNGSIGKTSNYPIVVQYRTKTSGGSYGDWITFQSVSKPSHNYTATASLTGLDYQTAFTFQARVIDSLHPDGVLSAEKVVIAQPVFEWGKNDFKFNVPVSMCGETIPLKGTATSESALHDILQTELNAMPLASKKTIAASFAFGSHGGGYYIIDLYKMAFDGYAYADASNYSNLWTRYTLSNHAWLPEEWHNPPMATGIEYRTTERWAGVPVYCYMVNIGALPNTTISEISHGLNATHVIRCEGVTNYGFALPFVVGSNAVHLACDKTKIYVTTTADYSYAQAYVTIYYTKT